MGNNTRQLIFPFHTTETAISNGKELNVSHNMVLMNIAVSGTATSFTLIVEAKDNDTDSYTPVYVANLETLALSSNITAKGKYQLGLEGHIRVQIRLLAISGGNLTVKGTVTN